PAAGPSPASMAGQPASTAARQAPAPVGSPRPRGAGAPGAGGGGRAGGATATVGSQRPRGTAARVRRVVGGPWTAAGRHLLVRRKGIMRSPGGEATRCQEE